MSKPLLFIFAFLFFSLSYSQDMSRIKVVANKLDFNTSLSEISADYVDGQLLYFQNKKAIKSYSQYYDLFMLDSASLESKKGDNNKVSLTEQLTIITNYHEGPCYVDEINNRIYITISSLDKKGMKREKKLNTLNKNRLRLLEGDFKDGIISNLKEFSYNNPIYNVGHATYSNATKRLYFVSTMPGTIGESDLFYCEKKGDGWAEPVNLGKRINSLKSELFPYVKNGILFFASDGQRNQVGTDLDLFFVKELEIMTHFLTELVGANTLNDDYAICFNNNESEFEGFFTSNRNNKFSGNDDIYSFTITNVDYDKNFDLLVKFTNNGEYLTTGTTTLMDDEGNEISSKEIDKTEFNYYKLERGKQYQIAFNNDEYTRLFAFPVNYYSGFVSETFDLENDAIFNDTLLVDNIDVLVDKLDSTEKVIAKVDPVIDEKKVTELDPKIEEKKETELVAVVDDQKTNIKDITEIPVVVPKKDNLIKDEGIIETVKAKTDPVVIDEPKKEVIKFDRKESFENIYFAFDSYTIYEYSQNKLDKLIGYMNSSNAKYVILNAYTDSRGSTTYNDKLSVKRALATREYLIENGIPEDKIKYQGFGETNLVNKCGNGIVCKDIDHRLNRRIEFTIAY